MTPQKIQEYKDYVISVFNEDVKNLLDEFIENDPELNQLNYDDVVDYVNANLNSKVEWVDQVSQ
jgi:hypothetical protein